jgi:heterotetrameric sarcosine oxidase alpha subunit
MNPPDQMWRLHEGGLIDRARPLTFTFNGRQLRGYEGDTLASALLANGVRVVGRSLKYHRPRGILTAGPEEPNALVQLGASGAGEPNVRATQLPLSDGLAVISQNCWPSVELDLGVLAGLLSPLLAAGFYYKTFMWPAGAWHVYERLLRAAAGLGRAPRDADPNGYATGYLHCDVLVVGGGAAGLAAAQAAARTGARVVLCDERCRLGGSLLWETAEIDGAPALVWVTSMVAELSTRDNVKLLTRACAFGYYDHNAVLIYQRRPDPRAGSDHKERQTLWRTRARQVVLATGAIERPLVFPDNERPGIMLAAAARAYLNQFAVRPGKRAVVVTNNSSAYDSAAELAAAGMEVAAIVDLRSAVPAAALDRAPASAKMIPGATVIGTGRGRQGLRAVTIRDAQGRRSDLPCDLLCVSGGWTPTVHLFSQSGGRLRFDPGLGAHLPDRPAQASHIAGAVTGALDLATALRTGIAAGASAARDVGYEGIAEATPRVTRQSLTGVLAVGAPPAATDTRGSRSFVDFQNDVTASDLALAVHEGFRSVEHVKRYTTAGMGTDQGKTGNLNALALVSQLRGETSPPVGHTTYRPPYTPVSFGAIAGRRQGKHLAPTRRTPFHNCWADEGATFVEAGAWLYPRCFPQDGEAISETIAREARQVRRRVGAVDMSTLGKMDVQGRDAVTFLERIYCNDLAGLTIGRVRYGVMLREDGIVFDDGTVARLGERHFLITTTTANAAEVWLHLEKVRQIHWPNLDVKLTLVSDHWANLAIAGPESRKLLEALAPSFPVGNEAFPFMAVREGTLTGLPARVFRISYSGELSYEINIPAGHADALWAAVRAAGAPLGLVPYGLEALDVLRIEKGHISVGTEIDGRTTPDDLGLGRLVSRKKDFIGHALLNRPALQREDRLQLVGLNPTAGTGRLSGGAQLVAPPWTGAPQPSLGHVTAATFSPTLDVPIALALLAGGRTRHGEQLTAASPVTGEAVDVVVGPPLHFDPEGVRLRV